MADSYSLNKIIETKLFNICWNVSILKYYYNNDELNILPSETYWTKYIIKKNVVLSLNYHYLKIKQYCFDCK